MSTTEGQPQYLVAMPAQAVQPGTANVTGTPNTTVQQEPPATLPTQQVQQPAGDPLDGMTPEQVDALAARIAETRANRPPSLLDALNKLQENLNATYDEKQEAVKARKNAGAQADDLEQTIVDLKRTMRRAELVEAATAAGFKTPAVIADHLVDRDGDVTTLVTEAVGTGAFAMKLPATSAQVGGPQSQTPAGMDAGMAAIVAEINAAHGR